MARARSERALFAGVFETTENTAPATGFYFLPHMSSTLGRKQGLIEDDLVGSRDPGDADVDNPVIDGDLGVPVDVAAMGWWLKALLGAPSTSENTGVFTHVYTSGAWSLPSLSFEAQNADVPSFEMFSGARAGGLQISFQRGGRVNATIPIIAQKSAAPAGTTGAGSPSSFTLERFMQKEALVQIDGTTVANVVSAEFNYSNNLDAVETITADGFIGGLDPMRASLSGSMRLRFDSEALFTKAVAGTAISLGFVLEKTAAKKLTLASPRVFLSRPERPITGPSGGVEANFTFQGARDTDGSPMLTATLINGQDEYA